MVKLPEDKSLFAVFSSESDSKLHPDKPAPTCQCKLIKQTRNKSLFSSFSSEKEQDSSFSEEKEAKRLYFLAPL